MSSEKETRQQPVTDAWGMDYTPSTHEYLHVEYMHIIQHSPDRQLPGTQPFCASGDDLLANPVIWKSIAPHKRNAQKVKTRLAIPI